MRNFLNSTLLTMMTMLTMSNVTASSESVNSATGPQYKLLYEQGFYSEALDKLDSLLAQDTSDIEELRYFRAACFIARGDTVHGGHVFEQILRNNCRYTLDTLFTPPKILAVFRAVKAAFTCSDTLITIPDSAQEIRPDALNDSSLTGTGKDDSSSIAYLSHDALQKDLSLPARISLGLLPGGAGQWYQHKMLRGVLIASAQIAAVAGCLWSYNKRDSYFNDQYGWYEGNRNAYEKYTCYARFGVTIFLGSYLYSIADYYLIK